MWVRIWPLSSNQSHSAIDSKIVRTFFTVAIVVTVRDLVIEPDGHILWLGLVVGEIGVAVLCERVLE